MTRIDWVTEDLCVYQPGNATRYRIYARLAAGGRQVAFMWLMWGDVGGKGMLVSTEHTVSLDYFMEKTEIRNECDAVALLCFLSEEFNVQIMGIPTHYRSEAWFRHSEPGIHEV